MKRQRPPSSSRGASSGRDPDTGREPVPPVGSPWDLPLAEAPFAFVDLEMTGLDVKADRVIEICIVRRRGEHVEDSLETLIHPGSGVIWQSDVHGLTPAALEHAPPFAAVATRVKAILDGAVLVAHAAWWDKSFLEAEFERLGQALTLSFYLDTLTLARRALHSDRYSLEALAQKLGIAQRVAHRAGEDVRVLSLLFDRVCEGLAAHSPRDLWHVRVAERHARPDIIAACTALAGTGAPAWIVYRPSHKTPRSFQVIIRQVRTDLDPPRVLGYSLPGRGRFDLRTDRILSISESSPAEFPARNS